VLGVVSALPAATRLAASAPVRTSRRRIFTSTFCNPGLSSKDSWTLWRTVKPYRINVDIIDGFGLNTTTCRRKHAVEAVVLEMPGKPGTRQSC
jgi:hypothetical protein